MLSFFLVRTQQFVDFTRRWIFSRGARDMNLHMRNNSSARRTTPICWVCARDVLRERIIESRNGERERQLQILARLHSRTKTYIKL